MTNDEAKSVLFDILGKGIYVKDTKENQAILVALRALEQDTSDDVISRQAVIEQTYNWSRDEFLRTTNPFDYLRKRINSLPPVKPQQKTGRWTIDTKGIITTLYRCSECNRTVRDDTGYSPYKDYPFCHCGAKMIEPQGTEVEE